MTTEQKITTVAEIAALARTRFNDIPEGDDEGALALASSHPGIPATIMFTKAGTASYAKQELTYYPLTYLRTSPRRALLLAEAAKAVVFPEDCDLYTIITPYEQDGQQLHALRWDEMAWYVREIIERARTPMPEYMKALDNLATWWHFPRAVETEPGMISYIPSHAYGRQHRRVKTKLGKYLKQFFGDVLDDLKIRDIVNFETTGGIELGEGPEAMVDAYVNGPASCMAGERGWPRESHPALCYAYPGEFKIATIRSAPGERPASRALVHWPTKEVVRLYGDADRLLASLQRLHGVKKVNQYAAGTKLAYVPADDRDGNKRVRLPYIDGEHRGVKYIPAEGEVPAHWVIVPDNGNNHGAMKWDIWASDASCTHVHDLPSLPCAVCGKLHTRQTAVLRYENERLELVCLEHMYPDGNDAGYVYAHQYYADYGTADQPTRTWHGLHVHVRRDNPQARRMYNDPEQIRLPIPGVGFPVHRFAAQVEMHDGTWLEDQRTFEWNGKRYAVDPRADDAGSPFLVYENDILVTYGEQQPKGERALADDVLTPDWLIGVRSDQVLGVCVDTLENRKVLKNLFDYQIKADATPDQVQVSFRVGNRGYKHPSGSTVMTLRQFLSIMTPEYVKQWSEVNFHSMPAGERYVSIATMCRVFEQVRAKADGVSEVSESEVAA